MAKVVEEDQTISMIKAYIGMGSNLDEPIQQLQNALLELREIPETKLATVSSFYRSKPVGPQDQPDFINAVAEIETALSAEDLLDALQEIEAKHERVRERHWGPRTLDLDILLFGDEIIDTKRLNVPHKEMLNRNFVLLPLFELTNDMIIPGAGKLGDYVDKCDESTIIKINFDNE